MNGKINSHINSGEKRGSEKAKTPTMMRMRRHESSLTCLTKGVKAGHHDLASSVSPKNMALTVNYTLPPGHSVLTTNFRHTC